MDKNDRPTPAAELYAWYQRSAPLLVKVVLLMGKGRAGVEGRVSHALAWGVRGVARVVARRASAEEVI